VARNIAYTQPTDFTNQGAFFPTMHEDCADRLGMQIQQLAGGIQRTLQLPDGIFPVASGTLPYPSPLAPLVWNAAGNGLANGSTSATGDMLLRGNLASTAAGNGASLVGFVQAGTGAVARTVQDKSRERISVKDFGAVGDGVTNDTAAIAAALLAAQSAKRDLYFPSGTYLSDPQTVTFANFLQRFVIRGEGTSGTIIKKRAGGGVGPLITFGATSATIFASNVVVTDITLDANSAIETPGALVLGYDLVHSHFINVQFRNGYSGVELAGGIVVGFDRCIWDAFTFRGLDIHKFASLSGGGLPNAITLRKCVIGNCAEHGIFFNDGRMLTLDDCDVEACGTSGTGTAGAVRVGTNVGNVTLPNSYGLICRGTWFERNAGLAAITCLSGRNKIDGAYFIANASASYDIYMNGCNYSLEGCVFDSPKTNNIFQDTSILSGNFIRNCGSATTNNVTGTGTLVDGFVKGAATIVQSGSGTTTAGTGLLVVTFPVAFPGTPRVVATAQNNSATVAINCEVFGISSTGFSVHTKSLTSGSSTITNATAGVQWTATY